MAAFEQNRLEMRKRNGVRLGHMGHIIRILNMIVSVDRDSTISPEWIHPGMRAVPSCLRALV